MCLSHSVKEDPDFLPAVCHHILVRSRAETLEGSDWPHSLLRLEQGRGGFGVTSSPTPPPNLHACYFLNSFGSWTGADSMGARGW